MGRLGLLAGLLSSLINAAVRNAVTGTAGFRRWAEAPVEIGVLPVLPPFRTLPHANKTAQ